MTASLGYKLSISVQLPKNATEGEIFRLTYRVKNIGNNYFPGGRIVVKAFWPIIGPNYFVNHPLDVEPLKPGYSYVSQEFEEKPIVAGYTIFTPVSGTFKAKDDGTIQLYLEDGKTPSENRPIGGIRARSHEEITQKQAVWIAIISLTIVAIFEIANLVANFLS